LARETEPAGPTRVTVAPQPTIDDGRTDGAGPAPVTARPRPARSPGHSSSAWPRRIAFLLLLALAVGLGWWRLTRPLRVEWVRPEHRTVTETIAVSGQVVGRRETVVGAQQAGVVAQLYVDEGDVVAHGQPLALIQNRVVRAQVGQAEQGLATARAQLAQAAAGARPSELHAASAQVSRAQAALKQSEAQAAGQRTAVRQAEAQVRQREAARNRARAAVDQAEARRDLARQNLGRTRQLLAEGAIARQAVDQAEADARAAEAEVAAAREGVATAEADVAAARASLAAARDAVVAADAGVAAARASVAAAEAERRTVEAGPRVEAVEVARQRVRDAEAALAVARDQARDARVVAPFAGTVTAILAERGASVAQAGGVVRLVQTGRLEIEADVDESNLADLRVGQRAVITSTTFRGARLQARVREIGAQVEVMRGTVTVKVVPEEMPAWLRPGLTVDLNIIVNEAAQRLVIPRTAVRRQGDSSIVIVPENGQARARPVILGAVEGEVVPVIEGVGPSDRVARHADRVQPGARVEE
jgi:HlyD family secretion protein